MEAEDLVVADVLLTRALERSEWERARRAAETGVEVEMVEDEILVEVVDGVIVYPTPEEEVAMEARRREARALERRIAEAYALISPDSSRPSRGRRGDRPRVRENAPAGSGSGWV